MGDEKRPRRRDALDRAEAIFREHGGALRTMEAIRLGVHPRTLYAMRDAGTLVRLARGLYRLADLPPLGEPDLVTVALRIPDGVLCLLSALAFHEMTTEIPHEVYVALKRGAEPPRLEHPPLRVFWFTGDTFTEGVETHDVDEVPIRIYSPAKTVADCFKYRNTIGLEVGLEALKTYIRDRRGSPDQVMACARTCRVENVVRPYIEALL